MTTAAACTVRTQYGSGVSSGNSSRTGRPVDLPPLRPTARLRCRSSAELLLRSDFPFLPPFPGTAGKAVQGAAGKGRQPEPGHGSLRVSSRPDMREKGRRKKGRTWAEAAKTVRRRERRGKFFFSPAARRREREVTWPRDRAEGHESARRGRRLGSRWRTLRIPRRRSRGCRFSRGLRPDPLVFQSGLPVGGQVAVAPTLLALVSAPCVVLAQ